MINSGVFKLVVASGSSELVTQAIRVTSHHVGRAVVIVGRWARPTYTVWRKSHRRSVGLERFVVLAKDYTAVGRCISVLLLACARSDFLLRKAAEGGYSPNINGSFPNGFTHFYSQTVATYVWPAFAIRCGHHRTNSRHAFWHEPNSSVMAPI